MGTQIPYGKDWISSNFRHIKLISSHGAALREPGTVGVVPPCKRLARSLLGRAPSPLAGITRSLFSAARAENLVGGAEDALSGALGDRLAFAPLLNDDGLAASRRESRRHHVIGPVVGSDQEDERTTGQGD